MAHSSVYYDGVTYVTLVAHVEGVNDLIDPADECPIAGLLEYSLYPGEGMLRVYDMDDDEMYDVHTVEDWEGLDKGAVKALLDAVDGVGEVLETGEDYRRVRNVYLRTRDPEEALMRHKVGDVLRFDYGNESAGDVDIVLKTGDNTWIMTGCETVWTDEEIEAYAYEVIYSAGENDE